MRHVWAITLLAPAVFLFAYLVGRRLASKHHFKRAGPTMLLGVWLTGGLFMTFGAILSRSEFIGGNGIWRIVMIFMLVIPIVTFILATLDGSALALLAITVGGLLTWAFVRVLCFGVLPIGRATLRSRRRCQTAMNPWLPSVSTSQSVRL